MIHLLGEGGRGRVYLAEDLASKQQVAVKVLSLQEDAISFREEARLLTRIVHPNLSRLLDYREGPPAHTVMEFIDGRLLANAIRKASFDAVLRVFVGAARGLHELHSHGLVHGDLTPGNIMVTKDGDAKLLDFGLPGFGTLAYWPPEAKAGRYDARSDLYSLGLSFSEALEDRNDLPGYFGALLEQLRNDDPSRRPSSALSLIRYLNLHVAKPYSIQPAEASAAILQKPAWVPRREERQLAQVTDETPAVIVSGPAGSGRSRFVEEAAWRFKLKGRTVRLLPDLHRTGSDELKAIELEIRRAHRQSPRPLFLLEYCDDFQTPELKLLLSAVNNEAVLVTLGKLSTNEARPLIQEAAAGHSLSTAEEKDILRQAAGLPLLLIEILRQKILYPEQPLRIAKGLETIIHARVASLCEEAAKLIALVATEDAPLTFSELEAASGWDADLLRETALSVSGDEFLTINRETIGLSRPSLRVEILKALGTQKNSEAHRAWVRTLAETPANYAKERLLHHALALNDARLVLDHALEAIGFIFSQGRYEQTVSLCDLSLKHLNGEVAKKARVILLGHKAPALYRLGRFDEAIAAYDEWFGTKGDDETRIETVKHRLYAGLCHFGAGRSKKAHLLWTQALHTGDAQKHPPLRPYHARIHALLAQAAESDDDDLASANHLKQAFPLAEGSPLLQGEIENQWGLLDQKTGRRDEAARHFAQAARALASNPQAEAIAWNHTGMLYRERGELTQALKAMDRALELAARGGEILQNGRYRGNRALVLRDLGRYKEAFSESMEVRDIIEVYGSDQDREHERKHREDFLSLRPIDSSHYRSHDEVRAALARLEDLDEQALTALVASILSEESPEVRAEYLASLSGGLAKRGLSTIAAAIDEQARQERQFIFEHLPEEIAMNEDAKKGLTGLEATLAASRRGSIDAQKPGGIAPERFRLFCDINRKIAQRGDIPAILEDILDSALLLTGAERGFLLLKNERSKEGPLPGFDVAAARRCDRKALKETEFKLSLSVVKKVATTGSSVVTDDAQIDPRFQEKKSVAAYGLRAMLAVPLEIGTEVAGVLYLDHRFQPHLFGPEDVLLLEAFANQSALAVDKAKTLEELRNAKLGLEKKVDQQSQQIEELRSAENPATRDHLRYGYEEIIGQSAPMIKVFKLLDHVTETTIPVWILGESGTGKEMIARSLHLNSARKKGPFVAENVGAIPETLLESELFGHKKGAFTHADRDRVGLFEQADGGTLFLDEVADMSLAMQAKLLRVLQEGEVRPVGSSKTIKIDVRLVTASNKDLGKMVKEGKFRQDLFFRINGLTIYLPALRERKGDIPLLVQHLAKKIAKQFGLPASPVADDALSLFLKHDWPGNVRELEATLRNLLLFAKGNPVTRALLEEHPELFRQENMPRAVASTASVAVDERDAESERSAIESALRSHRMDKEKAAKSLGMSLRTLYVRLDQLNIPKRKRFLARYLGLS